MSNFFLIPTLVSIGILGFIFYYRKRLFLKYKIFWISIIICFAIYLFFVGSSLIEDAYLNYKVNSFKEIDETYQYEKLNVQEKYYNERLINDSSRNLSVVFGFVISIIISLVYFIIAHFIKFIVKYYKN